MTHVLRTSDFPFKPLSTSALLVLLAALLTGSAKSAEGDSAPTPAARFEALLKQYDAPRGTFMSDPSRGKTASAAFLKLAREMPGDPVSFKALTWVVNHDLFTPEAEQAIDLLARDHIKSEGLAQVCKDLDQLYGAAFKPLDGFFRAVIERNPSRKAQALACLVLARRLKRDKEGIESGRLQNEIASKGASIPFAVPSSATDADLARMAAESAAFFQRAIDQYGDVKGDLEPVGQEAARELRDLRTLSVGMTAPEIEGADLDGKRFKLSDYRGKVVVLNFWNDRGCAVCRAMYPEERALVKRLENKPFVFLGVNSGDSPEVLKRLRDEGVVPWRFWVDGDSSQGKIVERWNVHGWPTIFVLDREGKIRMKGGLFPETLLGYVADRLLSEPGPVKQP